MATLSFLVEDQTDEEFFDKLVDDGFGIGDSSAVCLQEESDFCGIIEDQHVTASLASFSLNESENLIQVDREKLVVKSLGSLDNSKLDKLKSEKSTQKVEEIVSDASLESKAPVEAAESTADGVNCSDSELDFSFGRGHLRAHTNVKEVQWTSFHADVVDNELGGFGSYSDFFTELGSDMAGQTGEAHYGTIRSIPSQSQPPFVNGPKHELAATRTALDGSPLVAHDSPFIPDSNKDLANGSIIPDSRNAVTENSNGWDANYHEVQAYGLEGSQPNGQLEYRNQYWENLYPGWWYDHYTGEWRQKDGFDVSSSSTYAVQEQTNFQNALESAVPSNGILDQGAEVPSLSQTLTPVVQAVSQEYTAGSISNWNGSSQDGRDVYPSNMYFHPDYPGWYYDTNTQQWHQLDAQFNQSTQLVGNEFEQGYIQQDQQNHSTEIVQSNFDAGYGQQSQSDGSPGSLFLDNTSTVLSKEVGLTEDHNKEEQGDQWHQSVGHYYQHNKLPTPQKAILYSELGSISSSSNISSHHQSNGSVMSEGNAYDPAGDMKYYADHQISYKSPGMLSYGNENLSFISGIGESETSVQNHVPQRKFGFNQQNITQGNQSYYNPNYYGNQQPPTFSETAHLPHSYASYAATGARGSAGRPPHALVTFGFGGKLVIMKLNDPFSRHFAMERQDPAGGTLSIHSLVDLVEDKSGLGSYGSDGHDYFNDLCRSSFPGPLVGGNASNKDVQKWIDEKVATCESYNVDYRKGESLWVLLSLLKISCMHYGKLRSPFGAEATSQDNNGPESAVAKLFSSLRRNGTQLTEYGACTQCLQTVPSEASIRSTAIEVQKLLVAGRRLEALQCAQEGQLWGPALVLAGKLGEKYYVETVIQMAHRQFIYGSPLRTLCLLIAGQLADVFSSGSTSSPRQPGMASPCGLLDVWEENLSIVVANRTKGDELVITHLGDCLWKETGEVTAAHVCYLLAEANFETFSDSARLCLLGADHWKSPRTFATPDAIQRTELYEYAKVLGNPQFILQPFQPYKLVYAHMLAEVGKVSESLRYCEAILKSPKNVARAADVETLRILTSALEERLRTHQQGGFSSNLAPGKLVGMMITSIDRSIHRIIGGSPLPPLPPHQSHAQTGETHVHSGVCKISNGPSKMGVTTLMPSTSMEPISEWAGDTSKVSVPSRSISEPNFGRTPKQGQNAKPAASNTQNKTSGSSSRLGFFRTSIVDKLVGLVRPPQAKLGEKNKFYYDEKLKRWVEEGVDTQTEVAELAPPPTVASFQANLSTQNINDAPKSQGTLPDDVPASKSPPTPEYSAGVPPIPSSANQFSGRGRFGIRSRYVDTFNKGGAIATTTTFQTTTLLPAAKPGRAPAQFFIPISTEAPADQNSGADDRDSNPVPTDDEVSVSSVSSSMHRYPSMDNITPARRVSNGLPAGSAMLSSRQRAASWSGSYTEAVMDGAKPGGGRPLTEASNSSSNLLVSSPPSRFMPISNSTSTPSRNTTFAEELQEVEL